MTDMHSPGGARVTREPGNMERRAGWTRRLAFGVVLACGLAATGLADTVVKAGRAYTGSGEVIENAVVIIVDGRIQAVGAGLAVPDGADVIELPDTVLTPGLIDAMCVLDFEVQQSAFRGRLFEATAAAPETATPEAICRIHDARSVDGELLGPQDFWSRVAADVHEDDPNHFECVCAGSLPGSQAAATPLASAIRPRTTWAEHSSEVVPHTAVIDAVNLWSNDFERLCREGVTTVFVSPDSASVIGSRGAIVKTAGRVGQRIVRAEDAAKASMGGDPARRGRSNVMPFGGRASIHTRRPTTRMGVDWVFRKAFYDARRAQAGLPVSGADAPPAEAMAALNGILRQEIPLRIQARMQHDIFSAIRVAGEFGLPFLLEEATEAYQCLEALKQANLSLVFGPVYMDATGFRRTNGEARDPRLTTPRQLHQAGIPFALTAQEFRGEEGLARQAMLAIRYGLPHAAAFAAVTQVPARLMGLEERIGDLRSGLDADLVLWRGEPFSAEGRAVLVMIDGQVVYQEDK